MRRGLTWYYYLLLLPIITTRGQVIICSTLRMPMHLRHIRINAAPSAIKKLMTYWSTNWVNMCAFFCACPLEKKSESETNITLCIHRKPRHMHHFIIVRTPHYLSEINKNYLDTDCGYDVVFHVLPRSTMSSIWFICNYLTTIMCW